MGGRDNEGSTTDGTHHDTLSAPPSLSFSSPWPPRPLPSIPTSRSRSSSPSPPAARPTRWRATSREALSKPLGGQSVIIENVGGAGGTLGAAKVARAAPDGYTLLLHHIGLSTAPSLYRTLPYKTLDDFEYLGMVNEVPMTLIGKPTLPANNYAELRQVDGGEQGQDQPRQRRPGRRLAPVRPAAAEHPQDRHADGSLQGHGAGDERLAGRPGRHHVRPDDQHDRPDRGRQGEGLSRSPRAIG